MVIEIQKFAVIGMPLARLQAELSTIPARFGCVQSSLSSDHLALVQAFNMYLRAREKKEGVEFDLAAWCRLLFLDIDVLEGVRKTRDRLGPSFQHIAKLPATRASATDRTSISLAISFCTQAAIYQAGQDEYRTVHEDVAVRLAPRSTLVNSALVNGDDEWVVYASLTMSGGTVSLETDTAIDAEWLVVRLRFLSGPGILTNIA